MHGSTADTDRRADQGVGGDGELVERLRRGDAAARRELVDRHARDLFAFAYSLLGNHADAEDMVQETFLGALRRLDSFEGRASLRTWLGRILVNRVSNLRRANRVRRALSLDASAGGGSGGGTDTSGGTYGSEAAHPTVGSPALHVERRADISAMLDALSPEHREVIVLRELQGLSYDEMAKAIGVPRGTIESRLHRARADLRRRFAEYA